MQSAVNTRHWTLCLNWGSKRVCVRGTLLFTPSYTPPSHSPNAFGKDPKKKKLFVCFFPSFWSYIFSHGDVYQYLRELGEMGLFFLMLYLNLWYHLSLPICQMLSCDPLGWLERSDPVSCQSILQPIPHMLGFFLQHETGLNLIVSVCMNHFKVFF